MLDIITNPPFSSFQITIHGTGTFIVRLQKFVHNRVGGNSVGYTGVLYVNKNGRLTWYKAFFPSFGLDKDIINEQAYKYFEGYLLGMGETPGAITPFIPESDEDLWEMTA